MYNRYMYDDRDVFKDLYTYVADDPEEQQSQKAEEQVPVASIGHMPPAQVPASPAVSQACSIKPKPSGKLAGLNLNHLLSRFKLDDFGLVPLLILAFLIFDADDDEKLIIIALAFLIGL